VTEGPGEDNAFDEHLRRNFAEIVATRGPCPEALNLVRFALGDLDSCEASPIARHVAVCGPCDAAVFRLRRARRGRVWRELFAYAACGCLGVALAFVFWLRPAARTSSAKLETARFESVRVISLDMTRRAGLETAGPSAAPFCALAFFVPTESGRRYTGTLRNHRGEAVLSQADLRSYDGKGNFLLILPRGGLKSGEYQLEIEDTAGTRYDFEFNL